MNPYLSAVNQKLFFCRLLLKQGLDQGRDQGIESEARTSGALKAQLEQALCQSALYQLEAGYGQYLREIAATYQYKAPETITSAESLAEALSSINKHPAEAQEVLGLLAQAESWLSRLLNTHRALSVISAHSEQPQTSNSPIAVIEVKTLDEADTLNTALLLEWHGAFVEMVDRHRELMVEC